jgi:OmpA-OmpF porin, OOP family
MFRWPAVATALVCSLCAAPVAAQDGGFALEGLEPSPAGDVFMGVPSPDAAGHLVPRGYVMFDYAHRPIRLTRANDDIPVVAKQAMLRASLAMPLWERVLLSVDVPLSLITSGDDPGLPGTTFTALEAPRFGDVRIGLRGRLVGDDGGPFQLGLGSYLFTPSGDQEHYAGEGAIRGAFHAVLGGRSGGDVGFLYSASIGPELRASDRPHALTYGAGVGLLLADDVIQLGAEVYGKTALGDSIPLSATPIVAAPAGTNAEMLGSVKLRVLDGLTFGAGVGPGLGSTTGTPVFRALGMIGWTPLAESTSAAGPQTVLTDEDDDGVTDDIDACPDVPGEPNADPDKDGCPPADRDADGIRDVDDACPRIKGNPNADVTRNGCPGDSDGDGFHDGEDACPSVPGAISDDPTKLGCPPDQDGDGVTDDDDACPAAAGDPSDDANKNGCPADPDRDGIRYGDDACPTEAGPRHPDASRNGCPLSTSKKPSKPGPGVAAAGDTLEFTVHGSTLGQITTSNRTAVLLAIAERLKKSDVRSAVVEGHTDDSGDEGFNVALSERRAMTIRNWLRDVGRVPANKLSAKGYGSSKPAGDNRIRTGRQRNRRVVVRIVR